MNLLSVNREKCTKCSACVEVCPSCIIQMNDEFPQLISDQDCISCGHCVAVCPTKALDHPLAPLAAQVPIKKDLILQPNMAIQFLRSRRSIRCYKKKPLSKERLFQLLDIARFAPTSANIQGISYLVISNAEKLANMANATIEWMEQEVKNGSLFTNSYKNYIDNFRCGKDTVLRGAPHLIVAISPKSYSTANRENSRFTLEYVELLAPVLGIGTCWAGLVQHCAFSKYRPLLEIIDLPEDKVVVGAILAGSPKYSYHRLVDRNPLDVSWL